MTLCIIGAWRDLLLGKHPRIVARRLVVSVLYLEGSTTREQLLSLGLVWGGLLVSLSQDLSCAGVMCIRWGAAPCGKLPRRRGDKLERELAGLP